MAPPAAKSPYQLLVEGPDDFNSVIHLLARHGFDWDDDSRVRPHVSHRGGIDGLLKDIPVFLKSAAYQRVGIVCDANSDLARRWHQIKSRAGREGIDLPDLPDRAGTIVKGSRARIGVWVMPDNTLPGALEDFLCRLIPDDDPTWTFADETVVMARHLEAPCKEKDHVKSRLHTWLAWREEPGTPFGIAMKSGYFGKGSDEALRFVAWFHRLFVEP